MIATVKNCVRSVMLAALFVAGCGAGFANAAELQAEDVAALIAQARASLVEARQLGHGWTVIPQYIEEAEAALADKRLDDALASAQRAELTARQAVVQAETEASAWRARVPSL